MKKIILAVLLGLALFCLAYGLGICSPFLVCDVQTGVDTYAVDIDGIVTIVVFQPGWIKDNKLYLTDPGGTRTPCHILKDLAMVTTGAHSAKAKACNVWGCSADSSAYPFVKTIPGVPITLQIVGP